MYAQVGTASLLDKQLSDVGLSLPWKSTPEDVADHTVQIYIYVSDGGSDQLLYRRVLKRVLRPYTTVIFVESNCYMHMYQLVFKSGIRAVDHWAPV